MELTHHHFRSTMRSNVQLIILAVVSLTLFLTPKTTDAQQWSPEKEQDLQGFLTNLLECRGIPGLSVSVAQQDTVLFERGFGVSDLTSGDPVSAQDTRFCIGSCSKAFMATLLGSVLADYNDTFPDGWDTRLWEVFGPDFELSDSYRTNVSTIKDILSHRVGLATYPGAVLIMVDPSHSRQEYCRRMRYFDATSEFRSDFSYNNWQFMLASCVAEQIAGENFEQLIQYRIFDSLEMTQTILAESATAPGIVATTYAMNATSQQLIEMDPQLIGIYPAEASGGICGPVTDVTKWLQFLLGASKMPVLPTDLWEDTVTPVFTKLQPDISKPVYPVTFDMPNYGLGWDVGTYRGYRLASHVGSISGFESRTTVFKDVDLAIFTTSNGPMYNSDAHLAAHFYTADLVLGLEQWLDNATACSYPSPWEPNSTSTQAAGCPGQQTSDDIIISKNVMPSGDDLPIVGEFGHPFFGNISVWVEDDGEIRFTAGRYGTGFLVQRPIAESLYEVHFDGAMEYFHYLESNEGVYPPIQFRNLQGNETHGQYQEIYAQSIDPFAPPTYYRGFQWDDPVYPPLV